MAEMLAIGLAIIGTFFAASGSFFLKKGSKDITFNILDQLKNKNLLAGISLFGFGSLIFITALRFGELSLLYPITSLTYVWVSLISMKYLDEDMNKFKWMGVLLIIVGIVLVTG